MNARFWTSVNGDWVKITLHPGQEITWSQGGPTDEGWHCDTDEWSFDGEIVTCHAISDGCDCDGPLTRHNIVYCHIDNIRALPCVIGHDHLGNLIESLEMAHPDWQRQESWQRDVYAEQMNY